MRYFSSRHNHAHSHSTHYSYLSPVKDARLLQHIAQVDVGVQEVGVERHSLLEVVDGKPDLSLGVEHTA